MWWLAPGTELQVEGTHGGADLMGLNRLLPTRQQWPLGLLALGCGLPQATAAAAGAGDPSLQVVSASPEDCLLALGYQEPWQLLEAQRNQVFGQRVFWGLLSRRVVQ
jgi:hypothetical protein